MDDGWRFTDHHAGGWDTSDGWQTSSVHKPQTHWWSDALNDPWRDPNASTSLQPPTAAAVEPASPRLDEPDPGRNRTLWTVAGVAAMAALLAGLLGGSLGVRFGQEPGGANTLADPASAAPLRGPESLSTVAASVLPSVVTVRVPISGGVSMGSGLIVAKEGYVLTNDHVVSGSSGALTVIFDDGRTAPAKVIGADPESDVAVLKVMRQGELPVARLGDSESVMVGDPVVAMGSPLALRGTVTAGIVSALDRPITTGAQSGQTRYYAAIQTDAAVNHGNSGGPLVDALGQVVGINAVIKSMSDSEETAGNIGLAFAVPINHARRVAEEIIATGHARRTVIGAELEPARSPAGGVRLGKVAARGPAAAAGLKTGDVLISFDARPLSEPTDLIALVRKTAPGESAAVTYKRGSSSANATVTLVADSK